jgi:hypothetical protein
MPYGIPAPYQGLAVFSLEKLNDPIVVKRIQTA